MPNWISAYHLKKYYTPLTKEQLKSLHEAKWRKQNNQLKREEAKQRECNRKDKRAHMGQQLKICKLNLHKEDELLDEDVPQPIILIQIGLER